MAGANRLLEAGVTLQVADVECRMHRVETGVKVFVVVPSKAQCFHYGGGGVPLQEANSQQFGKYKQILQGVPVFEMYVRDYS